MKSFRQKISFAIRFCALALLLNFPAAKADEAIFDGKFFRGRGDTDYLQLLDTARRMFAPDPQYQNLSMFYATNWNGLMEGPTWNAWWIQNSYGTTYAALPFLQEPFITFLQNSQDLWFDQMGDGKRMGGTPKGRYNWIAPDGCLCDCASPGVIIYRQGDGHPDMHDWAMEFTAAGVVLQSELLLISRDLPAIAKYLPKLERSANFIETRRDTNNLFLAGPAGNLLAPSYAGWKMPDGTYGKAYLTGLSINYIAALDRLIELEKLAGRKTAAELYAQRRAAAKKGLSLLTTDEGYFIRSLDPDGVKHGVFGAKEHGYFETPPNHDAIAFRVADDAQSEKIFREIESIPGLRPHDFILPNFPSYDDMYEKPVGGWAFGLWVNGGHWSTCEARMVLAYYRMGRFENVRKSMRQMMKFPDQFRMDNPLTDFGNAVYQPKKPINLCYDNFGPPAALVRGLFEYLYRADGLTLIPHIPPGITELEQRFPIRFGGKEIYFSTSGSGPIARVLLNGKRWKRHDEKSIFLPYEKIPQESRIEIFFARNQPEKLPRLKLPAKSKTVLSQNSHPEFSELAKRAETLRGFSERLSAAGLNKTYEASHTRLALEAISAVYERAEFQAQGKLKPLPERSQLAADQSYIDTAVHLFDGLQTLVASYEQSEQPQRRKIFQLWTAK